MKKILSEIGTTLVDVALGIIIGIMITTILFAKFLPRPGPGEPAKIVENPTKSQEKKADVVVQEERKTELISRVEILQTPEPAPRGSGPDEDESAREVLALPVGEKFKAPAAGEIKTIYLDRSGRQIGEGVHQVAGETEVVVGPEWLDILTRFDDQVTVAVEVPEPPRKLWHIGGYLATDFDRVGLSGFAQRDFQVTKIGRVDVVAFGRVEMDYDTRVMVGAQVSF